MATNRPMVYLEVDLHGVRKSVHPGFLDESRTLQELRREIEEIRDAELGWLKVAPDHSYSIGRVSACGDVLDIIEKVEELRRVRGVAKARYGGRDGGER